MISVGKRTGGFTIIEVMIVLASTGALLLIAMTVIGGQVASTNFQTGTRAFATELQNVANQVTSGQYSLSNIFCQKSPGTLKAEPILNGVTYQGSQGANDQCLFAGKNIYADPYGTSGSIYIYSVATPKVNSRNDLSNDKVVHNQANISSYSMAYGLKIKCITKNKGSCSNSSICGLGLLATDNGSSNNGSIYNLYQMEGNSASQQQVSPCSNSNPGNGSCSADTPCGFYDYGFVESSKITSATFCIEQSGSSRVLGVTISSNANNPTGSGGNIQGSGFSVNVGLDVVC